jgi:phenylacetate-coenzyme A ligase PaaK-like adenylate-forming protein
MIDVALLLMKMGLRRALRGRYNPKDLQALLKIIAKDYATYGSVSEPPWAGTGMNKKDLQIIQQRRLYHTIRNAYRHVPYYHKLLKGIPINSSDSNLIKKVPTTDKVALATHFNEFISEKAKLPSMRCVTTASTSYPPTEILASEEEINVWAYLTAITTFTRGYVLPDDIVQICFSSRARPGTFISEKSCMEIGAFCITAGIIEPKHALDLLTREWNVHRKKKKVNKLLGYPSYVSRLIETAKREGYSPSEFEIEKVWFGGELVSAGLRKRVKDFFGAEIIELYSTTEIIPVGALMCENGRMHFDPTLGYVEVLDPETKEEVAEGEEGIVTVTPFYPDRETMPVIRYWTGDVTKKVSDCNCRTSSFPCVAKIDGRMVFRTQYNNRSFNQRDVVEALESIPEVINPVLVNVSLNNGVPHVAVGVYKNNSSVRDNIREALEKIGLENARVTLYVESESFKHWPLRGYLIEQSFA